MLKNKLKRNKEVFLDTIENPSWIGCSQMETMERTWNMETIWARSMMSCKGTTGQVNEQNEANERNPKQKPKTKTKKKTETAQHSTGAIVLKRIVVFSISFMCGFRHDLIYYTIYKQFIIMRAYYHLALILPLYIALNSNGHIYKKKINK